MTAVHETPIEFSPRGFTPDENHPVPPLTQVVIKSRPDCNLACDYCYEKPWEEQRAQMQLETVRLIGARMSELFARYDEPPGVIHITWHGGEPGLARPAFYAEAIPLLQEMVGPRTALLHDMQTSGTLLTPRVLETLRENRVSVGVSLDGDRETNDRHRRDRQGRSTYDRAVRGIRYMTDNPRYKPLFQGILSVIDLESDPVKTLEHHLQFEPPSINFLLPHANWQSQPHGITPQDPTPYADWLNKVYDEWSTKYTKVCRITFFQSIEDLLLDDESSVESIGGSSDGLLVIRTDGAYEMVDALKSVPGQPQQTGLNVREHSMEHALLHIQRQAKRLGAAALCQTCQNCSLKDICGGGYLPHRYAPERGLDNPSVYCKDLMAHILHIAGKMRPAPSQEEIIPAE